MSQANASALVKKLQGNEALKNQLRQAGRQGFDQFAVAQGTPCTFDEFSTALKQVASTVDLNKEIDKNLATIGLGNVNVL